MFVHKIFLSILLILMLFVVYGLIVPWMISQASTTMVIGAVLVMLITAYIAILILETIVRKQLKKLMSTDTEMFPASQQAKVKTKRKR